MSSESSKQTTPSSNHDAGVARRWHLPEIALLLAMTVAAFWPLLTHMMGWLIDTRDIFDMLYPIDMFAIGNLDRGEWPLWNSRILCGVPYLANPQTAFFYPPRLLGLLALGVNWMHPAIALHGFMAGAFMLIRLRGLGHSRAPALLGALAYGFGGYVHACAASGHLSMLWSMIWIPLIVHLQERAWLRSGWNGSVACGCAIGLQILGGQTQTTHYTIMIMAVGVLARAVELRDARFFGRAFAQFVVAGIVAGLLSSVQLAPMAEYGMMSDRSGASRDFAAYFPISPSSLLTLLIPVASYREDAVVIASQGVIYGWESVFYPGLLIVFFGLMGLMRRRAHGYVSFVVIGVLGLILALGDQTPLFRLVYTVIPGLGYFRIASRAVLLILWAMIHLAAIGFETSGARSGETRSEMLMRRMVAGSLASLFVVWIIAALSGYLETAKYGREEVFRIPFSDPQFYRPILVWATALAFLMTPWKRYANYYRIGAVGALALDLLVARPSVGFLPLTAMDAAPAPPESVWRGGGGFQGPRRMDSAPSPMVLRNLGMRTGMENINGYWPLMPDRYMKLIEGLMGAPFPENQRTDIPDAFYAVAPHPRFDLLNCTTRYAINAQSGEVGLAQFPSALPRAWFVGQHRVIEDAKELLVTLLSAEFDPRKTVLLEETSASDEASAATAAATVTVTRNDEDEIAMEILNAAPGWIVVSQNYFPGWRCRVNGEKREVVRANFAFMAFPVKQGDQKIELRYRPASVIAGGAISLLAWFACAALGAMSLLKLRQSASSNATETSA